MKIYQVTEYCEDDAKDDPEPYGNWPNRVFINLVDAKYYISELVNGSHDLDNTNTPIIEFTHCGKPGNGDETIIDKWTYFHEDFDTEYSIYEMCPKSLNAIELSKD